MEEKQETASTGTPHCHAGALRHTIQLRELHGELPMRRGSMRGSMFNRMAVVFLLLYLTAEFFQDSYGPIVSLIQSVLLFVFVLALWRLAPSGAGVRWLMGTGVTLGLALALRALEGPRAVIGSLVAVATLAFLAALVSAWRSRRVQET
jgi:hypothetical protein